MDDKTLLERAANAAGYKISNRLTDGGLMLRIGKRGSPKKWNPLTNYSDALRLAVDVNLGISIPHIKYGRIDVIAFNNCKVNIIEERGNDPYAATCRAIVRAAAEIGLS